MDPEHIDEIREKLRIVSAEHHQRFATVVLNLDSVELYKGEPYYRGGDNVFELRPEAWPIIIGGFTRHELRCLCETVLDELEKEDKSMKRWERNQKKKTKEK
jgi:hypothetical protein